jgi:EAL domain-containing protein (putative c-di-GMP-specific phosphodiesterase class I)/GGDEF domain-containing protein
MRALSLTTLLPRPRGLAGRATLFIGATIVVTAVLTACVVLVAAIAQAAKQEREVSQFLSQQIAQRAGDLLAVEDAAGLDRLISGVITYAHVRNAALFNAAGEPLHYAGFDEGQVALPEFAHAALAGEVTIEREVDGGFLIATPVTRGGEIVGVVVCSWPPVTFQADLVGALAPLLLLILLATCLAVPIATGFARRMLAPLDQLTRFAEQVGRDEHAGPIVLRTNDEFEMLATALNKMTAQLAASMRQIQEIAFVDPATRLPNQDRFIREVDSFILRHGQDKAGAVIVLNLHRLPKLMQTLAREAARDLARTAAQRLSAAARIIDERRRLQSGAAAAPVLTARLSGAEFAVFAPGLRQADAARFAQHLRAALNAPFDWRGHKLTLAACAGVAMAPRDGKDADAILRHARLAQEAAEASAAGVKLYTQSLDREAMTRLSLEREMRGALDRGEFQAYYQPKVKLATRRIESCEALARWVRPDRTIVSPGRFIPIAEESGLIEPLSEAILREACWKAAAWSRAGHPASVAVNVSALQFRNEHFAERVLKIVEHAGLDPKLLELEVTESVMLENPERAIKIVEPLREAGIRLAIDDFGCGHSNIAALSRLPFDVIKIDQQFVRAIERGEPQAEAIVEVVMAFAHALDMEVVAEGVERREEVEFMAARGCQWVQGFVFGAAVSAPEFAHMLRNQGLGARVAA